MDKFVKENIWKIIVLIFACGGAYITLGDTQERVTKLEGKVEKHTDTITRLDTICDQIPEMNKKIDRLLSRR